MKVSKRTIVNILEAALKSKSVNYTTAIHGIVTCMNDTSLEYILHMLTGKEIEQLIYPGDYIKLPFDKYHQSKGECDYSTLKDLGLITRDGMVYAEVISDSSWGSEYNPYYGALKIKYLYHDDNKQLKFYEDSINTTSVIRVDRNEIEYFKSLDHGKDITHPIEIGSEEMGNN